MRPQGPGHVAVLLSAVVELLAPAGRRLLVDCTVGLGGHSEALLDAAGTDARLIGIDLDETNLAQAKINLERFGGRVRLFQANFADVAEVLEAAGLGKADLLLADLGVASTQLDEPARGLSFQADGPLDMRLNVGRGRTAADLVNRMPEAELADMIYNYGEERFSRRIARAIVAARRDKRIERTSELARIVTGAVPGAAGAARRGIHPATRTFQALRIAVNDELGSLGRLLASLPDVLAPRGRAGIISFHSLEDRPVKQTFAHLAATGRARALTKKPQCATVSEVAANPRSRSAKFRVIEWVR
jgi:16S rRNA (cytosine1402-N4)-methyltransferase